MQAERPTTAELQDNGEALVKKYVDMEADYDAGPVGSPPGARGAAVAGRGAWLAAGEAMEPEEAWGPGARGAAPPGEGRRSRRRGRERDRAQEPSRAREEEEDDDSDLNFDVSSVESLSSVGGPPTGIVKQRVHEVSVPRFVDSVCREGERKCAVLRQRRRRPKRRRVVRLYLH